jgi:hypothetical protein
LGFDLGVGADVDVGVDVGVRVGVDADGDGPGRDERGLRVEEEIEEWRAGKGGEVERREVVVLHLEDVVLVVVGRNERRAVAEVEGVLGDPHLYPEAESVARARGGVGGTF